MPQCSAGDRCICQDAPLGGRHFCAFVPFLKKTCMDLVENFSGDDSVIT
jgi:hypothetical protein